MMIAGVVERLDPIFKTLAPGGEDIGRTPAARFVCFPSRQEHTFAEKMLSAMRQKFGGHLEPAVQKKSA